jgi:Short C-terminal domain
MRIAVLVISLGLTLVVWVQSCAVSAGGALGEDESLSNAGAAGVLVGVLFLLGGAFALGLPKASVGSFLLGAAIAIPVGATTDFGDLIVWGIVALVLAGMEFRTLGAEPAKPKPGRNFRSESAKEHDYTGTSTQHVFNLTRDAIKALGHTVTREDETALIVWFRGDGVEGDREMAVGVAELEPKRSRLVVGEWKGKGRIRGGKHADPVASRLIERVTELFATTPEAALPSPATAGPSVADELSRLADLHRSGALTDAEYEAAKAKLLS